MKASSSKNRNGAPYWDFNDRCPKHPRYHGWRRKAGNCAHCFAIYAVQRPDLFAPAVHDSLIAPFRVLSK